MINTPIARQRWGGMSFSAASEVIDLVLLPTFADIVATKMKILSPLVRSRKEMNHEIMFGFIKPKLTTRPS